MAEEAPDDGHVLDEDVEGDGAEGAEDAEDEAQGAEAVQREGLHHAEHVHVDVDGADEDAHKVHEGRAGDGEEGGQDDVGRAQGHGHPRVAGHGQQQLVPDGDAARVHHQQDALHPPLALLQEVPQGEWRLLPHLALDEVEGQPLLEGAHREEAVFRH